MAGPLDLLLWELRSERFIVEGRFRADATHDLANIRRVAASARRICAMEHARIEVVLPAAGLHDCIAVPKGYLLRGIASTLAARDVGGLLRSSTYPAGLVLDI